MFHLLHWTVLPSSGSVSTRLQMPLSVQTPPFSAYELRPKCKTTCAALLWLLASGVLCHVASAQLVQRTLRVLVDSWKLPWRWGSCWWCCPSVPTGCLCPGHAQQWMGVAVLRSDWLEPGCHHRRWEIVITGKEETKAFSRSVDYCCHHLNGQGRWIQKVRAVKEFLSRRDCLCQTGCELI